MPILETKLGKISYTEREDSMEFLGLRYGKANRFEYVELVKQYEEIYDATKHRDSCTQKRCWREYEHLEIPERAFYHKEFRENIEFHYSEDCFFLNLWTPKEKGKYPVLIFIHGGGFDSGSIQESPFDGNNLAKRGIVVATIQYRVGPFGYMTHKEFEKVNGHDGNFGLDDQVQAITWIKEHIEDFGGDKDCITLCGQSAGAISIQLMCISEKTKGLFQRAILMSGGGLWPKIGQPRMHTDTQGYWEDVMEYAKCKDILAFHTLDSKQMYEGLEQVKLSHKDNSQNMMPVIDGYYLTNTVDQLMKHPHEIDYMIGYTNNDMFALILKTMAMRYRKQVNGYAYYFDNDAKGDKNQAFHSADLRFLFGTLKDSWRPYDVKDEQLSNQMMDYIVQFVKTGNPNQEGLPQWKKQNKAMRFNANKPLKMVKPNNFKLLCNTFKGDPR